MEWEEAGPEVPRPLPYRAIHQQEKVATPAQRSLLLGEAEAPMLWVVLAGQQEQAMAVAAPTCPEAVGLQAVDP